MELRQTHKERIFKEIVLLLQENTVLTPVSTCSEDLGYAELVHVKDKIGRQYSLIVYSYLRCYDHHILKFRSGYIQHLKNKMQFLKQQNSSYLAKCYNDFMLGSYYVAQMERLNCSLQCWIDNSFDNQFFFVEHSKQILQATVLLHTHNYILDHTMTLKSFAITLDQEIKLIHFEEPYKLSSVDIQSRFDIALQQHNELFYYLPEILSIRSSSDCQVEIDGSSDIWCIGICLYYLAGATTKHILSYVNKREEFISFAYLGVDINAILVSILVIKQSNSHRPCIPSAISSFSRLLSNSYKDSRLDYLTLEYYNELFIKGIEQYHTSFLTDNDQSFIPLNFFESYVELNNQNEIAFMYLGLLYYQTDQIDKSQKNFQIALEINPKLYQGYIGLGKLSYESLSINEAFSYFERAVGINKYALNQIKAYLSQDSLVIPHQQQKTSEITEEINNGRWSTLYKNVQTFGENSDFFIYDQMIEDILSMNKTYDNQHSVLKMMLDWSKDKNISSQQFKLKLLKTIIEHQPRNIEAHLLLKSYAQENPLDINEIAQFYEKEIKKYPDNDCLYYHLALIFTGQRNGYIRYSLSIEENIENSLKINPDIPQAYIELFYLYKSRFYKSPHYVRFFKRASKYCQNNPLFFVLQGGQCLMEYKYQFAIICFKKALVLQDSLMTKLKILDLYKKQQKYEASSNILKKQLSGDNIFNQNNYLEQNIQKHLF